jgi:mannose-1-phosphate guanylyltransferase/mannose-1-phosphate guanylyltransferase/mannose-6-phosphate isomerase
VWRLSAPDAAGTVSHGDAHAVDANGCLIWSDGPTIAAIGVENLVIVATSEGVLVAPRERAQEVRAMVEAMAKRRSATD